jgi:hypothetical protein
LVAESGLALVLAQALSLMEVLSLAQARVLSLVDVLLPVLLVPSPVQENTSKHDKGTGC